MVETFVTRALAWSTIGLVAWGVLAFGAVYNWAYWPLFAVSAATGVMAAWRLQAWRDGRLTRIAVAALGVLAAAMLQAVALPAWMIAALSPRADWFRRAFEVGYHPANLETLSLHPGATWIVIIELVALTLLLIGVTRLLRFVAVDWLAGHLMGLAVAVATMGIVQQAIIDTDDPLLYGFWRPRQGGTPYGPFVNRNHFAGWMVMVLPVVAAYAWALVQQAERPRWGSRAQWLRWAGTVDGNRVLLVTAAVVILVVSLVLTGSRSGMASLAVAFASLGWFVIRRVRGSARWVGSGYLAAVLVVATMWAGAGVVLARFERAPAEIEGRLAAWRDTGRIIADFPVFGVGLGAYSRAMLVYQSGDRRAMYAEAHNDYLQWAAEGGLLVGVPSLGLLAVVLAGIRRRLASGDDDVSSYWLRRGAIAGLVGIAIQSIVEFSLQMPGNAVMCVVIVALALHRPRSVTHANRF